MKSNDIRKTFCDFFIKNQHTKVSSSSLIPDNDPSLLFANAGMNQFKDFFTGKATPPYKRAVTAQKCVRAGGKHNDLENVGFTARHHTFFEMLGNFSFGDYFKEEAISYHWELFTKYFHLPKDKLYITVHNSDDEAFNIWNKKIGIPTDRIFRKGDKDNFWEMGEFGPCGPCTEIFFDYGEKYNKPGFKIGPGQDLLDDDIRYVELANLVFMQFEKTPAGTHKLPNPCVDTGAGFERITTALQGKYWNYDTDIFAGIIDKIQALSGKDYKDEKFQSNIRVVADHIRSSTMLITDGVIPSNEGRGYVLRRIIRRAVRHLRELGVTDVSFYKIVPSVFENLGTEYQQNKSNAALAEKMLQAEETKFLETLDQGLRFLNEAINGGVKNKTLSGNVAFKLYDTFGFPLDLTEVILREKGMQLNKNEFDEAMEKQKETSRKSWKGSFDSEKGKVFHKIKDQFGETKFLGYEKDVAESTLLKVIEEENQMMLVFDKTPFYAESGGQCGDSGQVLHHGKIVAKIIDVQKFADGLFVHICESPNKLIEGEKYYLQIDVSERQLIMRNHSATHLLQSALIKVLGEHIKQAGSLVTKDKLRFDFTHPQKLSADEIMKVESLVNSYIQGGHEVIPQIMNKEQAVKSGALALFGEKYGDEVRVLKMGDVSTELCGGTHVRNTQQIGLFIILSESSLSSGIRRIEATTSQTALEILKNKSQTLEKIAKTFKTSESQVLTVLEQMQEDNRSLQKQLEQLNAKIQSDVNKNIFDNPETLKNNIIFISAKVSAGTNLRDVSDSFIDKFPLGLLLLYQIEGERVNILLRSNKSNNKINCSQLFKEFSPMINAKGGGRPDMVQASTTSNQEVDKFISAIKQKASLC